MILDLPMPPSVNRIWKVSAKRGGNVYASPTYRKWMKTCLMMCFETRWHKTPIKGPFEVLITLDSTKRRGDADNYTKAPIDFLHRSGITEDDRLCEKLGVEWGLAPMGCRVTVTEFVAP